MNVLPRAIMYPGAKTKAVWKLTAFLPERFDQVIEPFAGSAAFSIHLLDKRFIRSENVWLNDANAHLMNFYQVLVSQTDQLVMSLLRAHREHGPGSRELFEEAGVTLRDPDAQPLAKAIAYFIDNCTRFGAKQEFDRSTFSEGLVAGRKGLHKERILRLLAAAKLLRNARLTESDYRSVFAMAKPNNFVFLDPPYPDVSKDHYGKKQFDDDAFVVTVQENKEKFLFMLTLNDTPRNRAAFSNFLMLRKSVYYGLKRGSERSSNSEIVVFNYTPPNVRYWVEKHECEIIVNQASKGAWFFIMYQLSRNSIAYVVVFYYQETLILAKPQGGNKFPH